MQARRLLGSQQTMMTPTTRQPGGRSGAEHDAAVRCGEVQLDEEAAEGLLARSPAPDAESAALAAADERGVDLLVEAGAVLATSLDLQTTMRQVARLTVPRLADVCAIDLRDEAGAIREVAVAASEHGIAKRLAELRAAHPLSADGLHPVASMIRTGKPLLFPQITRKLLKTYAESPEHTEFMLAHDYRSAIVAPLLARGRTLGALSTLRLGGGEQYTEHDLDLVCELARRAAMAIDNARLYSDLHRVESHLQAVLATLAEAVVVEVMRGTRGVRQPGRS